MLKKLSAVGLSFALVWTSAGFSKAANFTSQIFASPSHLAQFSLIPPANLGRIVDYFNAVPSRSISPEPQKAPLVVLIQDLHTHYGVQKNIAGLLDFLADHLSASTSRRVKTAPPFALAVEGASGPIDSSILANFPDAKVKEVASQFLMYKGELSGAEYFAVKHGQPKLLVGVENDQYYNLHRELFRKTYENRKKLVDTLSAIDHDIATLPRKLYSGPLQAFQKDLDNYDKGYISTAEFIALLVNRSASYQIDLKKDFPVLASFAMDAAIQRGTPDYGPLLRRFLHPAIGLSPEALRVTTTQFLSQAETYLTGEEKANLKVLANQSDISVYYLYMRELVYQHHLFLAVPPELAHYLEYVHTEQTMGIDRILQESQELGFRIKISLAKSQQEKDLVQVQHDLGLFLRVADLQATVSP
jgi:hypothetical protein